MGFTRITEEDIKNKGVSGLPDTPNLSVSEMQAKFEELETDVIIPKFNELVDELESGTAAANIGIVPPAGFAGNTVQGLVDEFSETLNNVDDAKHSHSNKVVIDRFTAPGNTGPDGHLKYNNECVVMDNDLKDGDSIIVERQDNMYRMTIKPKSITDDMLVTDFAKVIEERATELSESISELESEVANTYATKEEVSSTYATQNDLSTEMMNQYRNIMGQVVEIAEDFSNEAASVKADVILANASGESIHLADSTDNKAVEFALLGKATQNGTPTPDALIDVTVSGADGSVEVKSLGKNFLQNIAESKTVNNVTFTVNENKSVTVNTSGATANTYFSVNGNLHLESGNYILSDGGFSTGDGACVYVNAYNSETGVNKIDIARLPNKNSFEYDDSLYTHLYVGIYVSKDKVCNVTFYPMVSLEGGEYEPYKESITDISTPNGLAGINGVCDEKRVYADGTGQYIQKIGKIVFDGSETWYKSSVTANNVYWITVADAMKSTNGNITYGMLCDRFMEAPTVYQWSNDTVSCAYGNPGGTSTELRIGMGLSSGINTVALFKEWLASNPTTIYYRLAEPVITDLTAEEIAEMEVQTFYPTTNILNDAGCGMEVTYKADTKNYIDKIIGERISAIETALINNI